MSINLSEELIKPIFADKRTQALMPDNLMHHRVIHVSHIHVVRQNDNNAIIIRTPPTFGTSFPASGEVVNLRLVADYSDMRV